MTMSENTTLFLKVYQTMINGRKEIKVNGRSYSFQSALADVLGKLQKTVKLFHFCMILLAVLAGMVARLSMVGSVLGIVLVLAASILFMALIRRQFPENWVDCLEEKEGDFKPVERG